MRIRQGFECDEYDYICERNVRAKLWVRMGSKKEGMTDYPTDKKETPRA